MDWFLARDIMSTSLTVISAKTPVNRIAALLAQKMISAAPVVDEGFRLIGIVSEADLLTRGEADPPRRSSWWLRFWGRWSAMWRRLDRTPRSATSPT
jgi:CBS-domain-containing membrane protein